MKENKISKQDVMEMKKNMQILQTELEQYDELLDDYLEGEVSQDEVLNWIDDTEILHRV